MDQLDIKTLLEKIKNEEISIDEGIKALKIKAYEELGFAKLDSHRGVRQGVSEVIYGASKTPDQIIKITKSLIKTQDSVLITRLEKKSADIIKKELDISYNELAKVGIYGNIKKPDGIGKIVVATGGTSDMYAAEEAALTCEFLGNEVVRLYDVGVAGIHRLFSHLDEIMDATVIIAIAGMEGALASVIGGLADCPVIAVPTSVGYGASFNGLAALLSMLNSCSSGVSVVNIDNGFGAAYQASMINHLKGIK